MSALLGVPLGLLGPCAALLPVSALRYPFRWALPGGTRFLWMRVADPATAVLATSVEIVLGLFPLRWAVIPAARVHARLTLARLLPSRAEPLAAREGGAGRSRADGADPPHADR
ncbi:hypothetical protein PWG71_08980 [Nocardiopsis sp. N85]|uniref:hypothetical protein n=1 Tax=Nocardiopsis sp. N85 TaxID=3029400 RepID=UPI00237F52B8|nr:hypothetical protein [Nocardiopsis sp. N85]MDE3721520.1 hypothetical protein [Nocardiopsis sp. N85]